MSRYSELTGREKSHEVVRWLGVLPAALLASIVTQFIMGVVVRFADLGERGVLDDSQVAYCLRVFLYYVPWTFVLVMVGAKTAPRHQFVTAVVLTVLGTLLSLMTHVVGQHLAGNQVGVVNYTHFAAESAGALSGAAIIFLLEWRNQWSGVTG